MMRARAGPIGAIDGSLDVLVDESVGIIRRLDCGPAGPDAPAFHHCEARLTDTRALGGEPSQPVAGTAAVDPRSALTATASLAIATYSAALYRREAQPLASYADADFTCVRPADFALFSLAQYASPGFPYVAAEDDTPLRWATAVDLATGESVHVPAAMVFDPFVYHRKGGDKPIAPPSAGGLACADGVGAAALAGLADVICRDAMALFWQAMTAPPQVPKRTMSPFLQELFDRFEIDGDRLVVLDVTTDNTVPAFVAILQSDRPERPAFVCDAGAGLDPEAAVALALTRLAATRRRFVAAAPGMVPPAPTNDWEDMADQLDHLFLAADHGTRSRFDFAFASDIERDFREFESRRKGSVDADLDAMVGLIAATGHKAYAANLTTEDVATFGIAVCRVLVPGYQSLHVTHRLRPLGGRRLYEAPQRLGYRGIAPGTSDNPSPHPFAA